MELARMLKALGEPTRFQIYCRILERKHCVRSLSRVLGISEPAVSQHLKVMREAGLIYGEKYGRHTHYLPRQEAVDALADAFFEMRQQSRALDRSKAACQCAFRREERP